MAHDLIRKPLPVPDHRDRCFGIARVEGYVMAYRSTRLPSRFPAGTKFVIESEPREKGEAPVYNRYLEFPDGTLFPLPAPAVPAEHKAAPPKAVPATRRRARRTRTRRRRPH